MLVLTRKIGERLYIGDSIVVTVVQIEGGKIRLGIEAPPEVRVMREELQRKIDEKNQADSPQMVGQPMELSRKTG